eukprot:CAMPEP_0197539952 /NCGR_PEP_ID=MMETSP1318-20131121/64296_1 /TAXON_ID=552666 /ORGANISM="Partenskyella glossopodia, Strain RCC365" /LENGTH=461 /DNA_ID=CAMNT_0043098807 /DNA_START=108 /DNA_END=1493 /DNA_ORIENTATION=+
MAKKKSKSKKTKKKGVTEKDLREQKAKQLLEQKQKELYECMLELNHEEALVNEYLLQKQRLNNFWELSKKRRQNLKRDERATYRKMLNLEEKQRFEMKIYKEKIKHLLHEQQAVVVDEKIDAQRRLKLEQNKQRNANHIENQNMRMVKVAKKTSEFNVHNFLNRQQLEHQKKVMELREEFEHKQNELIRHNRQTMDRLRKQKEAEMELDIEKFSSIKDRYIKNLMAKHQKKFEEIRDYYKDITLSNLDKIKTHKDQVAEMKQIEQQLAKEVTAITNANKKLSLPLRMNRKLTLNLRTEYEWYKKDKVELAESLKTVHGLEAKIKDAQWEHEVLQQKLIEVERKRDSIKSKLTKTVEDVQQKVGFKHLLLNKKIQTIDSDIDTTNAALREVINTTNLPPEVVGNLKFTIEDVIQKKSQQIEEEQDKRVRIRKQYYDTIRTYEAILKKYHIPLEELGFVPASI